MIFEAWATLRLQKIMTQKSLQGEDYLHI